MHLLMKFVSTSSALPMTMGMQCSDEQASWAQKGLRGGDSDYAIRPWGSANTSVHSGAAGSEFFLWCFCPPSLAHAASVVSHFLHHDKQTLGK